MHDLPQSFSSRTVESTTAQEFFKENFGKYGNFTLTATYGEGAMVNDLIPEERTNICFKAPYKTDLTRHTPQVFDDDKALYDNAVNMANYYINQNKDVIILSSKQADVFALDRALGLYASKNESFKEKSKVVTLASLQDRADHKVFEEQVGNLNQPFGKAENERKKGYVINATDVCSRGFNFDAGDAVLISIGCPSGLRGQQQKDHRVGRKGCPGIVHRLIKKRK